MGLRVLTPPTIGSRWAPRTLFRHWKVRKMIVMILLFETYTIQWTVMNIHILSFHYVYNTMKRKCIFRIQFHTELYSISAFDRESKVSAVRGMNGYADRNPGRSANREWRYDEMKKCVVRFQKNPALYFLNMRQFTKDVRSWNSPPPSHSQYPTFIMFWLILLTNYPPPSCLFGWFSYTYILTFADICSA